MHPAGPPPTLRAAALAVGSFAGGTALGLTENPPEWLVVALFLLALLSTAVALTTFPRVRRWIPFEWTGFGLGPRVPKGTYIKGRSLRVVDLAELGDPTIKDRVFEDCQLHGPGLVAFLSCGLSHLTIDTGGMDPEAYLDAMLWEVESGRRIGAVGFERCVFSPDRAVSRLK